jgi:hypothetical protein
VKQAYWTDPFCCVHPLDIILSHSQRATLVCADPSKIKCAQDVTALLDETAEWDAEWAAKVFDIITKFKSKYAGSSEQTQKKHKQK